MSRYKALNYEVQNSANIIKKYKLYYKACVSGRTCKVNLQSQPTTNEDLST